MSVSKLLPLVLAAGLAGCTCGESSPPPAAPTPEVVAEPTPPPDPLLVGLDALQEQARALPTGEARTAATAELVDAARTLGSRRIDVFFRIHIPLLLPSILAAFMLVFTYSFLSFGIVLVFGGLRFVTLEVRIYQELFTNLDATAASLYGLLQLGISVLFISGISIFFSRLAARRRVSIVRLRSVEELPTTGKIFFVVYGALMLFFVAGPLVGLIIRSLSVKPVSGFAALFGQLSSGRNLADVTGKTLAGIILRSLSISGLSGFICFTLASALARKRRSLDQSVLMQAPLGVSFVSFSIGLRLIAGESVHPVVLVVAAQVFVAFPVVYRIVATAFAELHREYADTARTLGASAYAVIRDVQIPLLRRGLANGLAFAFAISFADFTGILTIGRGKIVTFPVAIYRLLGFRGFDAALALSVVYAGICLCVFVFIDVTSKGNPYAPA